MPQINTPSIEDTSRFFTSYTGNANETNQTFTFFDAQNGMTFSNKGKSGVILNIDGNVYKIPSRATIEIDDIVFTSFDVRTQSGTQDFTIKAFREKSNVSGLSGLQSQVSNLSSQLAQNATIDKSIAFAHGQSALPRLRRTENRKVISHLNGTVIGVSTDVVVNQPSPRRLDITTPGNNNYTIRITPTRDFGVANSNYLDLIFSALKWDAVTSFTMRLIPDKSVPGSYYTKLINKNPGTPNIPNDLVNNKAYLFRTHKEQFSVVGTPAFFGLNLNSEIFIQVNTTEATRVSFHEGILSSEPMTPHMLMFDDAFSGVYDYAFPIMRERGITGTVFVITDFVGQQGYCTWEQLHEMQEAGWTIGNHTATHENMMSVTLDQAIYSIEKGAAELAKRGFRGGGYLALPQNSMDSTRDNYFGHVVHSMRLGTATTGTGLNRYGNPLIKQQYPAIIRARSISDVDTPQFIYDNDYLSAKSRGLMCAFNFHGISSTKTGTYYYRPDWFEQFVDMLIQDKVIFVNYEEYSNAYLTVVEDIQGYVR